VTLIERWLYYWGDRQARFDYICTGCLLAVAAMKLSGSHTPDLRLGPTTSESTVNILPANNCHAWMILFCRSCHRGSCLLFMSLHLDVRI